MARLVKERMSINTDPEKISLDDLVNARTVSAVIQAFFGSSQLSQFMDQTNPLAELTHKRRLSALGPGGLTRERAGFEVRDVHYSQYGRMCPIETPEGPNIGLITSLACYARVNDLGFVETPYRVVKNGKVTNEIAWLDANREEDAIIAQANAPLNADGTSSTSWCSRASRATCRSPRRTASITWTWRRSSSSPSPPRSFRSSSTTTPTARSWARTCSARPFRSSTRRRRSSARVSRRRWRVDSGAVVIASRDGVVSRVTADEIIVDAGPDERARSRTEVIAACAPHAARSLQAAEVLAHEPGHRHQPASAGQGWARREGGRRARRRRGDRMGQLALGANVIVAFMPWYGHNFEDAIVLSERLVKDDVYSSIHIQELELHVRDTKRGQEEITREIPNVAEESAARPRRARHRAHRRAREAGRHPRRQDHAEGRDGALS